LQIAIADIAECGGFYSYGSRLLVKIFSLRPPVPETLAKIGT